VTSFEATKAFNVQRAYLGLEAGNDLIFSVDECLHSEGRVHPTVGTVPVRIVIIHVHSLPSWFAGGGICAVVETMEPTVSLSLDDLQRFPGVMHAYPATVRTTDEPVVVAVHRDVSVGQFPSQVSSDDGGRRILWANPRAEGIAESVEHMFEPAMGGDRAFVWDAST